MADATPRRRTSAVLRGWLRAAHRDLGYLAVGLTFVYALSGLAVNHVKDWDPSFRHVERRHHVALPLPPDDAEAARRVLASLGVDGPPRDVFRTAEAELSVVLDARTFRVDVRTGDVIEEADEPRPVLRLANWLHLNRGKPAWTIIADTYAALLLVLATSGMFMIAGRKGLLGRGAILVGLGAAVPVLYVVLSGGP